MNTGFTKWIRIYSNKIAQSIAFYPALIALIFLLVSWGMLEIDFSGWGKELKSGFSWLSLKDASTARSIISTVAGAIISLTVFSFSMVMIVLNQAASQMSNRVLSSMIENRFQQIILGIYIGTIVYAFFLLSTIRDLSSGVNIPALSIYLLLLLTIIDIFLFIYFLDYVTSTVKYETVIDRVRNQTMSTMKREFKKEEIGVRLWENLPFTEIKADQSGYFQSFNQSQLLTLVKEKDIFVTFLFQLSRYVLKDLPFIRVYAKAEVDESTLSEIKATIDFFNGQPIDKNSDYGFRQLTEVAIKALSPGINDPGTAVICLQALSDILAYKLSHEVSPIINDSNGTSRIYCPITSFGEIFSKCIEPIWNYGKEDQFVREELTLIIEQLSSRDLLHKNSDLLNGFLQKVKAYQLKLEFN